MIPRNWFDRTGISYKSPLRETSPVDIYLTSGSSPDDADSIKIWTKAVGSQGTQQIKQAISRLSELYPLKLVSVYRPTGTHRYGAVDIAPHISDGTYAHNRHIDPRLYARPAVLKKLARVMADLDLITCLVEDNHLHFHARNNPGVPSTFPKAPLVLQIRPRPGYSRTMSDIKSDEFYQSSLYWVPLSESVINALPEFQRRF